MNKTKWNPTKYQQAAGFVAEELGSDLLTWVTDKLPLKNKKVLDLGCGDGVLSQQLLNLGANVTGLDGDEAMVAAAQERGISASVADARSFQVGNDFDLVFTNAVLHWVKEKDQVATAAFRALKPGGTFAGEFGGDGCAALICEALTTAYDELELNGNLELPWHFVDTSIFAEVLEGAGFAVQRILMFEKRPELKEGMTGWLETFGSGFTAHLQQPEKDNLFELAAEKLKPGLYKEGVWRADYVRLRFEGLKT